MLQGNFDSHLLLRLLKKVSLFIPEGIKARARHSFTCLCTGLHSRTVSLATSWCSTAGPCLNHRIWPGLRPESCMALLPLFPHREKKRIEEWQGRALPLQCGTTAVPRLWVANSSLVPALWLAALGAAREKPTACCVYASTALCLEIRADRQSHWSTLEALFYCCFTAEIAERSRKRLALLPHCSARTWPAAGDGGTLRLFGVQQQLVWMLKNWKYQQSSLYATEFPAAGLVPAKLAQFKSETEFLLQTQCVSRTKSI